VGERAQTGAPIRQRVHATRQPSRASLFENAAGDEMAFLVEMIVDLGVNRAEFL